MYGVPVVRYTTYCLTLTAAPTSGKTTLLHRAKSHPSACLRQTMCPMCLQDWKRLESQTRLSATSVGWKRVILFGVPPHTGLSNANSWSTWPIAGICPLAMPMPLFGPAPTSRGTRRAMSFNLVMMNDE